MIISAYTDPDRIIKLHQDVMDTIEETLTNKIKPSVSSQLGQLEAELNYGLSQDAYIENGASPFNAEANALVESANNLINEFSNFENKSILLVKKQIVKELRKLLSEIEEKIFDIGKRVTYADNEAAKWNAEHDQKREPSYYCHRYNEYMSNMQMLQSKLEDVKNRINIWNGE